MSASTEPPEFVVVTCAFCENALEVAEILARLRLPRGTTFHLVGGTCVWHLVQDLHKRAQTDAAAEGR